MQFTLAPVIVFLVVELAGALPVVKHVTEEPKHEEKEVDTAKEGLQMTPHKIDPYDPRIRSAWDEERRKKLELLRQYYNRERELENGVDLNPFRHHEDGDPAKLHAAEIAEVKTSIQKLTEELTQIDHYRRELFKQYEMQKKWEEQQKEKEMDEEKRKQYHLEQERLKEKHKKHEPLHHPGSKQQLEEVWEKQDHVEQEFDPEAFFNLHDLDSNQVWDQDEVKSLFQKELDKMYQEGLPEDDLYERREEMERMREHIFQTADRDRNGFIDFHEFLKQTQEPEFQKDEGWKGLDEQQIYTQEDYDNYLREHQRLQQQAAQANANAAAGAVPPHPNAGNYYQVPPQQQQQQQQQQQHVDPNLQYHQGQVPHPAQYQNQVPLQQQQYQGHQQMAGQHQQQIPVYQHQQPPPYPQMPVQQQQHHQLPQQQQYQVPHQVPHDQVPLEQQQYQHQVVQQTHHQPQQNTPDHANVQQQQQNIQQQQHNNDQLSQVPPVVQNVQNQASVQQQPPPPQQQQQQQHVPNNVEPEKTHAVPAVVQKDSHV